MLVAAAYTIIILLGQPYLRKGDDRLHLFVQIELLLVVLAGYILVTTEAVGLPEATDLLLSIVMIIMTVGVMTLFAGMAVMNLRKIIRTQLRKRKEKRDQEQAGDTDASAELIEDPSTSPSSTSHGTTISVPKHRSRDKNRAATFADQQMSELASMKKNWVSI